MPKVVIYTAEWCPWCKRTKEFYKQHGVKYQEKDVEKVEGAAHEMIELSGQSGIPVSVIDGQIVVGFDVERLKQLLKITG